MDPTYHEEEDDHSEVGSAEPSQRQQPGHDTARDGGGAGVGGGVAEVLHLLLAQQENWKETQRIEERRRQEAHELQLQTLRAMLESRSSPHSGGARHEERTEHIKLTKLAETDDVEAFLTTFERVMTLGRVPEGTWTLHLAPQLSGKALQAYAATSTADAAVYAKVKEAILRRYEISEETYRQRFRGERKRSGEAYSELTTRLYDLAKKWLGSCGSGEEVVEKLVVEQLLVTMPADLRVWLAERKPGKGADAGRLADDYVQARRHVRTKPDSKEGERTVGGGVGGTETRKCHKC